MNDTNVTERRRDERIQEHKRIDVCCDDGMHFTAQVMNWSEGGVRIYSSQTLAQGAAVRVVFGTDEYCGTVLESSPRFTGFAIRVQYS